MKESILSIIASFTIASFTFGQASNVNTSVPQESNSVFKLTNFSFQENINFYDLNIDSNITEFVQSFKFTPTDYLAVHLDAPVYTTGVTGSGMLCLGVDWNVVKNPLSFLDSIVVGAESKLPTSSAGFGGGDVNYLFSCDFKGGIISDKISWNAGVNWELNIGGDYIPVFGGLVYSDITNAYAGINYKIMDNVSVGANYNYWSISSGQVFNTIGPSAMWNICPNANLTFACDIPFESFETSQLDLVVKFGLGLKF